MFPSPSISIKYLLRSIERCRLATWLVCLLTMAQASAQAQETDAYEITFPAMGTMLAFQSFSDDQAKVERVYQAAQEEIERLVEILSDYSAESETVLLSQKEKVGHWQNVSPELWQVLETCDQWHKLTNGAFDASVGQLSILWRKARKSKTIPTQAEIDTALKQCGWQHVELDKKNRRIKLKVVGLRLDFGALGKGFIIDKAYDYLAAHGLPCSLVRAGGDLRCGTPPPERTGWPIEIARLSDSEEPIRFRLSNAAVSSSGDLFQYLEVEGVRRSHVLDPRTGIGVPGPRMVTVIAPNSMLADVADTALCVLPDEQALALAKSLGNIQVRLATVRSGQTEVHSTPDFPTASN